MLTEIELNIYRKYIYLMNATLGEFPFVFSISSCVPTQLSSSLFTRQSAKPSDNPKQFIRMDLKHKKMYQVQRKMLFQEVVIHDVLSYINKNNF
jgi:hypothetical protein